ncbi:MAG: hypothetical protein ACR2NP_11105 [Pirellulaceae bacterium]
MAALKRCMQISMMALLAFALESSVAQADDYYVSAANGRGKKATQEQPAKDLGNIVSKLKPGDTIHIAGGEYLGRGECGTTIITVPVTIIGGYDETFTTRDPWGEHQTIFSGNNTSDNWQREPALMLDLSKYREREMPDIVVDGIIVDHANRNRYADEDQLQIVRAANPKTGANPTPDQGGLVIRVTRAMGDSIWNITVRNCVVMNTAGTQGALSVSGHAESQITLENNLIINNTGTGIVASSSYAGSDENLRPVFNIANNTVLFTWKYDASAQSFSGNSLKASDNTIINASNNVFGFADKIGVHNASQTPIMLVDNLIIANILADYLEFDTKMNLDEILDEAEYIHEDSDGNTSDAKIEVPVSRKWAEAYGSRVLIDRNAVEADIEAQETRANELRSILGLPLQAGTIDGPDGGVWLCRLSIEDAINAGSSPYLEKFGCRRPDAGE